MPLIKIIKNRYRYPIVNKIRYSFKTQFQLTKLIIVIRLIQEINNDQSFTKENK